VINLKGFGGRNAYGLIEVLAFARAEKTKKNSGQ
jgi:hypothetical protein